MILEKTRISFPSRRQVRNPKVIVKPPPASLKKSKAWRMLSNLLFFIRTETGQFTEQLTRNLFPKHSKFQHATLQCRQDKDNFYFFESIMDNDWRNSPLALVRNS